MYAVIKTGGKQYKVSEGDILRVEKLDVERGGLGGAVKDAPGREHVRELAHKVPEVEVPEAVPGSQHCDVD